MKRVSTAFRHRSPVAFLGAVALLAGGVGLRAATQQGSPADNTSPAAAGVDVAPSTAAMRAGIDPETGLVGLPSDAQARASDVLVPQAPLPPVEILADGTLRQNIRGHYRNFSVARVGAGGRIETECSQDAEAARRFLNGEAVVAPAPAPATPEE